MAKFKIGDRVVCTYNYNYNEFFGKTGIVINIIGYNVCKIKFDKIINLSFSPTDNTFKVHEDYLLPEKEGCIQLIIE